MPANLRREKRGGGEEEWEGHSYVWISLCTQHAMGSSLDPKALDLAKELVH